MCKPVKITWRWNVYRHDDRTVGKLVAVALKTVSNLRSVRSVNGVRSCFGSQRRSGPSGPPHIRRGTLQFHSTSHSIGLRHCSPLSYDGSQLIHVITFSMTRLFSHFSLKSLNTQHSKHEPSKTNHDSSHLKKS
jgi:hypothetical protein